MSGGFQLRLGLVQQTKSVPSLPALEKQPALVNFDDCDQLWSGHLMGQLFGFLDVVKGGFEETIEKADELKY